jgi:hypothetical protein
VDVAQAFRDRRGGFGGGERATEFVGGDEDLHSIAE